METNVVRRAGWQALAIAVLVGLLSTAPPAAAQLAGLPTWVYGATLVPDPPLATGPTTLLLYGVYPAGCGDLLEASVGVDHHVTIRLRSSTCIDTASGQRWVATLPLDTLAAGIHTVPITITMEENGGTTTGHGTVTFEVVSGGSPPPPGPPGPPPPAPPPPPSVNPLLEWTRTDPDPPTPSRPMALILGGFAPFGCPVVTSAAVIDTSHLAVTLSPATSCEGDSVPREWSHRFELGLQREGHHAMSLAVTLAGDTSATVNLPVEFIVVNDSVAWGPPPDSLANLLSTNRPNPFVQTTQFSVSIDTPENADVGVFDLQGRRVRHVFHGRLPAGTTQLAWNGFRDDGARAVAGVYFYRLEMRGRVVSRRLILLPRR